MYNPDPRNQHTWRRTENSFFFCQRFARVRQEWSAGVGKNVKSKTCNKVSSRGIALVNCEPTSKCFQFGCFSFAACTLGSSECWWIPTVTSARKILLIDFSFSSKSVFYFEIWIQKTVVVFCRWLKLSGGGECGEWVLIDEKRLANGLNHIGLGSVVGSSIFLWWDQRSRHVMNKFFSLFSFLSSSDFYLPDTQKKQQFLVSIIGWRSVQNKLTHSQSRSILQSSRLARESTNCQPTKCACIQMRFTSSVVKF